MGSIQQFDNKNIGEFMHTVEELNRAIVELYSDYKDIVKKNESK